MPNHHEDLSLSDEEEERDLDRTWKVGIGVGSIAVGLIIALSFWLLLYPH